MMSSGIICIHCGKAVRHLEIDKNQLKSLHKSEKKRYEIQVKKINVILLFIAILIMSVSIIPLIGYEEIFEFFYYGIEALIIGSILAYAGSEKIQSIITKEKIEKRSNLLIIPGLILIFTSIPLLLYLIVLGVLFFFTVPMR